MTPEQYMCGPESYVQNQITPTIASFDPNKNVTPDMMVNLPPELMNNMMPSMVPTANVSSEIVNATNNDNVQGKFISDHRLFKHKSK